MDQVSCVELTMAIDVAGRPSNVIIVPALKFAPSIVTKSFPVVTPLAGLTLVIFTDVVKSVPVRNHCPSEP